MEPIQLEKVQERLDLEELNELVTGSVREGFRHLTRLVEDYHAGSNRFDQTGEALFLCRVEDKIVGICGLNRDPYYGEGVGRVRRLYVHRAYRRHGIGHTLTKEVLNEAAKHYNRLVLWTDNPAAAAFYVLLGFTEKTGGKFMTHFLDLNTFKSMQ
ncbi:GNAT family N-acetyltransferase [Paenibacillus sp. FJAT-26967]|uniref:GNAT family N-acetyltransferase n=1 Tax=Paenibacillus sp. FJAT-26967 TaxID=1729690 RepID=UPI000837E870|nr:GNAT family N-acetyltransferase [Paenibacillus sp. FJAT-26967]